MNTEYIIISPCHSDVHSLATKSSENAMRRDHYWLRLSVAVSEARQSRCCKFISKQNLTRWRWRRRVYSFWKEWQGQGDSLKCLEEAKCDIKKHQIAEIKSLEFHFSSHLFIRYASYLIFLYLNWIIFKTEIRIDVLLKKKRGPSSIVLVEFWGWVLKVPDKACC